MPSYFRDPAAPAPNRPRRVGAVGLIVREGALLLELRRDFEQWGLIGGAVDEDEDVTTAIVREVREETGLAVVTTDLFGIFSDPSRIVEYPDGSVYRLCTIVFTVETAPDPPVASDESLALRFFNPDELRSLSITAAHRPIVDAFLARPAEVVVA